MPRAAAIALSALLGLAVPAILVGNALWLLLGAWFVDFQYALPGFPAAGGGIDESLRSELAKTGLASVRPGGEGVALLREAALPGGEPAFEPREVRHMAEVGGLIESALIAWGIALAAAVGAGLALGRRGEPGRALARGAALTVAAMALVGLFMAVAFEAFFDGFHSLFFAADSWRFEDSSTLRRLYPDAFWTIGGAAMAVLVLLQAGALLALLRLRRGAPSAARKPAASAHA